MVDWWGLERFTCCLKIALDDNWGWHCDFWDEIDIILMILFEKRLEPYKWFEISVKIFLKFQNHTNDAKIQK